MWAGQPGWHKSAAAASMLLLLDSPPSPPLSLSRLPCAAGIDMSCRLRVLCFPNAGNAEDMYTSEGTGARRAPSPLLEWCRAAGAEVLAVQPPGRLMRGREPPFTTCADLAAALLPVVASRLLQGPYVVRARWRLWWWGLDAFGRRGGSWCGAACLCCAAAQRPRWSLLRCHALRAALLARSLRTAWGHGAPTNSCA